MKFEYDPTKQDSNLAKHGIRFEDAAHVFLDENRLDEVDNRKDYSEERRVVVGEVGNNILVVAYTLRADAIRLISARKANDREKRKYYEIRDRSEQETQTNPRSPGQT